MTLFRLATEAIDDLDALTQNEAERSGWDHSMDIEAQLWSDFELLGRNPGIGHPLLTFPFPQTSHFSIVQLAPLLFLRVLCATLASFAGNVFGQPGKILSSPQSAHP